jgi:hypothetical protein
MRDMPPLDWLSPRHLTLSTKVLNEHALWPHPDRRAADRLPGPCSRAAMRSAVTLAPAVTRKARIAARGTSMLHAVHRSGMHAALAVAGIVLCVVLKLQAHGLAGPRGLAIAMRVCTALTAIGHRQWRRQRYRRPRGRTASDANSRIGRGQRL